MFAQLDSKCFDLTRGLSFADQVRKRKDIYREHGKLGSRFEKPPQTNLFRITSMERMDFYGSLIVHLYGLELGVHQSWKGDSDHRAHYAPKPDQRLALDPHSGFPAKQTIAWLFKFK